MDFVFIVDGRRDSCLLERRTRGRKVASSNPGRSGGSFLLQSQLWVLTLIQCPFHPRGTAVVCKRSPSFCQKCRGQVTAKPAYTLNPTKLEWADYAAAQA